MARALEHVIARSDLDQIAQPQHRHPVGHLGHDTEVVGDEEHAGAMVLLQLEDQPQDLRLGGHIECGGRLIGDQQHRVEHQRHRDHDALALAARQLVRITRDDAVGIGQQHLANDCADLGPALAR